MSDNVPIEIGDGELLGRRIFQSDKAKRARRDPNGDPKPVFDFRAFFDLRYRGISVDRLGYASVIQLTEIADAEILPGQDKFYGWFVIEARVAAEKCELQATGTETNPFHADLWLPEAAIADPGERKNLALDLAQASKWRERAE